ERSHERGPVDERRHVVRVRVAEVDRDRVAAVLGEDWGEPSVDLLERLVPGGLDELAVAAHQRRGQAIRILMQLLDPVRLWADEAAAEDVVRVAPNRHHLLSLDLDLEPACGFAEWTGPVVRGHAWTLLPQRDPEGSRGAGQVAARVVQRGAAPALAPVPAELPRQDRVLLADVHRASEPRGEAGEDDRGTGVPVPHRRARGAVERRPQDLRPDAAVVVAGRLVRRPCGAEQPLASGDGRGEDPEPVGPARPADDAGGERVSRGPAL